MGTTKQSSELGFVGIILLAALLLSFSPAYGGTISESFNNNQYNTQLWSEWHSGQGTTVTVANNELEVTVGGNGYSGLTDIGFTLPGDFTMMADFTLLNWQPNNGTQLTIGTSTFQAGRANTGQNGQEQYFIWSVNNNASTGVTGLPLSGKLRIVRTGNTMTGSYYDGSNWITIGSATAASLGGAVEDSMEAGPYNYTGIQTKVAFDNIQITYNTGHPNPGLMLLLM